jgi:hypothetical protein
MRCLYCGKELALFKRLRGGEFCSDAHRLRYQEEYTQLALNRLLQANPQEKESAPSKPQETKSQETKSQEANPAELESPALKRREKLGREETPTLVPALSTPLATASASIASPVESAVLHETPKQTAVLDPEPADASVPAFAEEMRPLDEPGPAGVSSFLVEYPVAAVAEAAAITSQAANLETAPELTLPRFQEPPQETIPDRLDPAGRITLSLFTAADFHTPPRERGLELREFVRGVHQVEIRVRPASETGLEPAREQLNVDVDARPPEDSPDLWQAFEEDLPALGGATEILLGDLARLDFAVTGWEEAGMDGGASVEEPPSSSNIPAAIGSVRLEPMRVEPIRLDPAWRESSGVLQKLEPLHFEPVHIDPVFMEQIAGTAEFNALKTAAEVKVATGTVAPETTEAAAPLPPTITRPLPVTLHGLAPVRGKPMQVFTAAVSRSGDVQIPRETGLPLRPTMVWGLAPKPANVPSTKDERVVTSRPIKSIPVPEKRDPRPTEIRPRRSEVGILPVQTPVQAKAETLLRQREPAGQTEPVKAQPANKTEQGIDLSSRELPAKALKETPAEKPKAAPAPVEIRAASPVPAEVKPRIAPPAEEPDMLGLPKLSYQNSESFWRRSPVIVRIGAIAGMLALIVGGVFLTSRGSGAAKNAAPADGDAQVVEAGSALANTAGWMQDWFTDGTASRQGRHVDVLKGTLTMRDYRLVFEGLIEHGALGWVFRANNKSFYVEKIQVVTAGLAPVVVLEHFAVIDGQEQPRTQVPLPIQAHLDTTYKVRMDAVGNRFTTWVQGEKVDQWTDNQIDAGGVGLYYDSGDSAKLRDTLNVIPLKQR